VLTPLPAEAVVLLFDAARETVRAAGEEETVLAAGEEEKTRAREAEEPEQPRGK